MLQRLPGGMQNDVQMTRAEIEGIKRKILISRIPQDAELEACKNEVAVQVKNWRATFQPLEIPVAIWTRNFQILDYNKTFTEICGCKDMLSFCAADDIPEGISPAVTVMRISCGCSL